MDGSLPDAATIWRRWLVLASAYTATGRTDCSMDAEGTVSFRDPTQGWWRMRWVAGQRAVIWGAAPGEPVISRDDLLDLVPDWAVGDRDAGKLNQDATAFVIWYRRGHWGAVARAPRLPGCLLEDATLIEAVAAEFPQAPAKAVAALVAAPSLAALAALTRSRQAAEVLDRGLDDTAGLSATATEHLREAIHAQMRAARELGDRGHPKRPSLLRQWAAVNLDGVRFRFAVHLSDQALHVSSTTAGLTETEQRSLANVLLEIRETERRPDAGAWLFGRVKASGRSISLERAYDHWPSWYSPANPAGQPRPEALAREMNRRAPVWVPGWSVLLPRR